MAKITKHYIGQYQVNSKGVEQFFRLNNDGTFVLSDIVDKIDKMKLFDTKDEAMEYASYNLPKQIWEYVYYEYEIES